MHKISANIKKKQIYFSPVVQFRNGPEYFWLVSLFKWTGLFTKWTWPSWITSILNLQTRGGLQPADHKVTYKCHFSWIVCH